MRTVDLTAEPWIFCRRQDHHQRDVVLQLAESCYTFGQLPRSLFGAGSRQLLRQARKAFDPEHGAAAVSHLDQPIGVEDQGGAGFEGE